MISQTIRVKSHICICIIVNKHFTHITTYFYFFIFTSTNIYAAKFIYIYIYRATIVVFMWSSLLNIWEDQCSDKKLWCKHLKVAFGNSTIQAWSWEASNTDPGGIFLGAWEIWKSPSFLFRFRSFKLNKCLETFVFMSSVLCLS